MNSCKVLKLPETNLKRTRRDILEPHAGSMVVQTWSEVFSCDNYRRWAGIFSLNIQEVERLELQTREFSDYWEGG